MKFPSIKQKLDPMAPENIIKQLPNMVKPSPIASPMAPATAPVVKRFGSLKKKLGK